MGDLTVKTVSHEHLHLKALWLRSPTVSIVPQSFFKIHSFLHMQKLLVDEAITLHKSCSRARSFFEAHQNVKISLENKQILMVSKASRKPLRVCCYLCHLTSMNSSQDSEYIRLDIQVLQSGNAQSSCLQPLLIIII